MVGVFQDAGVAPSPRFNAGKTTGPIPPSAFLPNSAGLRRRPLKYRPSTRPLDVQPLLPGQEEYAPRSSSASIVRMLDCYFKKIRYSYNSN